MSFSIKHTAMYCGEDGHDKFYNVTLIDFGSEVALIKRHGKTGATGVIKYELSSDKSEMRAQFDYTVFEKTKRRSSGMYEITSKGMDRRSLTLPELKNIVKALFSNNALLVTNIIELAKEADKGNLSEGYIADNDDYEATIKENREEIPEPPKPHANPMRGSW